MSIGEYIVKTITNNRYIIEIPDNVTNGDVIKALFPNGKYAECKNVIALHTQFFGITCFDKEWWNAPYMNKEEECKH